MTSEIAPNTQAILLLTAPLITGKGREPDNTLSAREYKVLVKLLVKLGKQPEELLGSEADHLLRELAPHLDTDRLRALLGRGFLLAQAIERWRSRSIWVVSRADAGYPQRIKRRLKELAPPVIYGCGDRSILDAGGLAVVGSRAADEEVLEFAAQVGSLAGEAGVVLVSGGARGVDSAAMRGAAEVGGKVAGVLADRLEAAAVNRDNRTLLISERLVLITPYDPSAGFSVGHAMQRNKLIYALADAALVVSTDLGKGGTWAGAVEQLEKLRFGRIFVRSVGERNPGLDALKARGAVQWPDPLSSQELRDVLLGSRGGAAAEEASQLSLPVSESRGPSYLDALTSKDLPGGVAENGADPGADINALRALFGSASTSWSVDAISEALHLPSKQVRVWLNALVAEGVIEKQSTPVRYRATEPNRVLPL